MSESKNEQKIDELFDKVNQLQSDKEALQKEVDRLKGENTNLLGDLNAASERDRKLLENATVANGAVQELQSENVRLREALEELFHESRGYFSSKHPTVKKVEQALTPKQ